MIRHVCKLIWHRKRTNLLLMIEIFFSVLVLFGVGALGVYMAENWRRPIGFTPDNLWVVNVDMRVTTNDTFTASQVETMRLVLAAAREVPEVEKVAGALLPPYVIGSSNRAYTRKGRAIEFGVNEVTDEFNDVLGLRIVQGRWFGREDDGASYLPVVINNEMAEELFPGQDPIGQNLAPEQTPGSDPRAGSPTGPVEREQRVVGVVAAYREDGEVDGQAWQALYRKPLTDTDPSMTREPAPGEPDPADAGRHERPRRGTAAEAPAGRRTGMVVHREADARIAGVDDCLRGSPGAAVGLIAGFLMLMVAMGLTGVLWQSVTQRTREIGLRRAKGAERSRVQRQILGELVVMTSMAVGVAAVLVAQVPIISPFYWVDTHVYVVGFIMAAATIYLLTLLCGWYPSRLATRVEPAEALRYE